MHGITLTVWTELMVLMSEAVIVVMVDAKAAVKSTILVLSNGLQKETAVGHALHGANHEPRQVFAEF